MQTGMASFWCVCVQQLHNPPSEHGLKYLSHFRCCFQNQAFLEVLMVAGANVNPSFLASACYNNVNASRVLGSVGTF